MNHFHPEVVSGRHRPIASHYTPQIGPYDSRDTVVVEYQLLTMKLAGIDGIIVDWRGLSDLYSYPTEHQAAIVAVNQAMKLGMKFAVMYEDASTLGALQKSGKLSVRDRVPHVGDELAWMLANWASSPNYVKLHGAPLLLSFGNDGLSDEEWDKVLRALPARPAYFSEHNPRPWASGAFDWPDPRAGLKAQMDFYARAKSMGAFVPVAYPRFHDIYAEAGIQPSWGSIPDDGGKTFKETLSQALKSGAPVIQIATWNDWGEGTSIEPSEETGMRDLLVVQSLREKSSEHRTQNDLMLPYRLLSLRRGSHALQHAGKLDEIALLLASGDTLRASRELGSLEQRAVCPVTILQAQASGQ